MRSLSVIPVCLCLLAAAACDSGPDEPEIPEIETTTFAEALDVDLSESTKTTNGLYYRDLEVGSGSEVATGQLVGTHYTGWLADGTKFGENGASDAPLRFRLGIGQVIPGWDLGLPGMRVGGTRQLIIPPSLGYGARQNGPIPPYSILVFEVEVVSTE